MQQLKQIQFSVQQQSIAYSYSVLGNLLSSAENFVGLQNEQYGYYNISKARSKEELKSEFAWELYCFQLSYKQLLKKFHLEDYPYPKEAPKEKILDDIEKWASRIETEKDFVLFNAMENIILGKKTDIDFDELFEEIDSSKKLNPKKLKDIIGPLNNTLDKIIENANENEKKGKSPNFYVGGTISDKNNPMNKLKKVNDINDEHNKMEIDDNSNEKNIDKKSDNKKSKGNNKSNKGLPNRKMSANNNEQNQNNNKNNNNDNNDPISMEKGTFNIIINTDKGQINIMIENPQFIIENNIKYVCYENNYYKVIKSEQSFQ